MLLSVCVWMLLNLLWCTNMSIHQQAGQGYMLEWELAGYRIATRYYYILYHWHNMQLHTKPSWAWWRKRCMHYYIVFLFFFNWTLEIWEWEVAGWGRSCTGLSVIRWYLWIQETCVLPVVFNWCLWLLQGISVLVYNSKIKAKKRMFVLKKNSMAEFWTQPILDLINISLSPVYVTWSQFSNSVITSAK